ncbi:MAG TPA: hydrogenase maturation nickel metallochaperone HypA [Pseudonocardiaceae bacterium]|nr:hydrogenase maturation nickel metallochaperone HypA [Pseudonocardiaceae bacterium]
MHEMAITQSVVHAVCERMGDAPVRRVCLEIGTLSGVVADSVRFCFDLITEGTTLEGASLEIVQPSGKARCRDCGVEFALDDLLMLCACGSANRELLAGEELRIREVEVLA